MIFSAIILVSACSGSSETDNPDPISPPDPIVPPTVNPSQAFVGKLTNNEVDKTSQYIRNGLYGMSVSISSEQLAADSPSAPSPSSGSFDQGSYSTTNTQEVGVDEADRIEFDGKQMYVADFPIWFNRDGTESKVRLLEKQSDGSLVQQTELVIDDTQAKIGGMYLYKNSDEARLAVLSLTSQLVTVNALPAIDEIFTPEPLDESFAINIYDTTNINNVENVAEVKIDGYLVDSRRIENMLYVISTFVPKVPDIVFNASDEQTQLDNYTKILALSDDELLPNISINGQIQEVTDVETCFIPEDASDNDGYAQTIHITGIDLDNPNNIQTMCMSAVVEFIYASQNSIYLSGRANDSTYMHKVSLGDSVNYEASGVIPGVVGWNAQPQLRFSEWEETLRVVTTDYQSNFDDPDHNLFMLQQQGNNLAVIGQLPNEQQPQTLGKPGEDLYAVRYVGDRGYLVTFERIDPLYVIDLAEPTQPSIIGELEIPGFSSYLQPFDNGLLLGVGQEVSLTALPETGEELSLEIRIPEMKISLFDVRDPQNPIEVSSIKRERAYTPVEFDYRALSVLSTEGLTRFAMPTETWSLDALQLEDRYRNSLLVFDVDSSQSTPSMTELFEIAPEQNQSFYIYSGEDRSIITDEGIYYLRGNGIFYQAYDSEELAGPY